MTSYSRAVLPPWAANLIWPLVMLVAIIFSAPAAFAAAATPAETFVQQNIDKGYAILNASLSDEQRRAQFRTFMLALTDTRRIGMFTLGQYANGASKADLDKFTDAFIDYAVAVYESRLSKYKGQTLKVTGSSERAADDVVVNADVVNPNSSNGQPFKVGFRVRKTSDGRPIITDMQVEGVWLALSQRSDFTGFLQQHGGSLAALTENLHMQAQQIHASAGEGSRQAQK
ncbi:MAG: phospholipid transport system substrate-binding protein [Alphaproteobacteria bacterium]|jgi:phospholipid transport system substrate-binding protein|nr:phospholipid transport system substrate-binding protein [Alphaproteobacteria bacterium]